MAEAEDIGYMIYKINGLVDKSVETLFNTALVSSVIPN